MIPNRQESKSGATEGPSGKEIPGESDLRMEVSDLKPGDVLLHASLDQDHKQKIISAATSSPFTHASIYIGDGSIAHAVWPHVKKEPIQEVTSNRGYIGVLRSQMGFGSERIKRLHHFVDGLVARKAGYDSLGAMLAPFESHLLQNNQLHLIKEYMYKPQDLSDFNKGRYFCSALIVACFSFVGIIDPTAQAIYPHIAFTPGDLHRDATFGWLQGYLIPSGVTVPEDDPLKSITHWKDIAG